MSEGHPERVIKRMEQFISEAVTNRDAPEDEMHPIAEGHAETIRRQATRRDVLRGLAVTAVATPDYANPPDNADDAVDVRRQIVVAANRAGLLRKYEAREWLADFLADYGDYDREKAFNAHIKIRVEERDE